MNPRANHDAGAKRGLIPPALLRQPIGDRLKSAFSPSGPMPDRLTQLADALEQAFERGELTTSKRLF